MVCHDVSWCAMMCVVVCRLPRAAPGLACDTQPRENRQARGQKVLNPRGSFLHQPGMVRGCGKAMPLTPQPVPPLLRTHLAHTPPHCTHHPPALRICHTHRTLHTRYPPLTYPLHPPHRAIAPAPTPYLSLTPPLCPSAHYLPRTPPSYTPAAQMPAAHFSHTPPPLHTHYTHTYVPKAHYTPVTHAPACYTPVKPHYTPVTPPLHPPAHYTPVISPVAPPARSTPTTPPFHAHQMSPYPVSPPVHPLPDISVKTPNTPQYSFPHLVPVAHPLHPCCTPITLCPAFAPPLHPCCTPSAYPLPSANTLRTLRTPVAHPLPFAHALHVRFTRPLPCARPLHTRRTPVTPRLPLAPLLRPGCPSARPRGGP